MNILVTGGAGYIGSACVKKLVDLRHKVIVIDNLSKGQEKLIDKKAIFFKGDLTDINFLETIFSKNNFDAVIHFAAYKSVGESMKNPGKYNDNIFGTANLLDAMARYKTKKIIFSSSAAVYGEPEYVPVDENHALNPVSYYGFTKLKCEEIIEWYSKLSEIVGIRLRYFNVAGDAGLNYVDESPENVFPLIMEVYAGKRDKFIVFGKDYDTKDGTCVRDYIDINDLIDAHISALNLNKNVVINLGSETGVSVKELIDCFEKETGRKLKWKYGSRRKGDPDKITASAKKAKKLLNWNPKKRINDMVKGSIRAYYL